MLHLYARSVLLLQAVYFAGTSLLACTAHQGTIFLEEIAFLVQQFRTVLTAPIMQLAHLVFLALH